MSFTEEVLNYFGREVVELTLIPSKGGVFEVEVNGKLIYSKKETGEFPDPKQLCKVMDNL